MRKVNKLWRESAFRYIRHSLDKSYHKIKKKGSYIINYTN